VFLLLGATRGPFFWWDYARRFRIESHAYSRRPLTVPRTRRLTDRIRPSLARRHSVVRDIPKSIFAERASTNSGLCPVISARIGGWVVRPPNVWVISFMLSFSIMCVAGWLCVLRLCHHLNPDDNSGSPRFTVVYRFVKLHSPNFSNTRRTTGWYIKNSKNK
jgi:hypothetical protein